MLHVFLFLSNISMVFQNVYLLHDTIRANICFGRENVSKEATIEAADQILVIDDGRVAERLKPCWKQLPGYGIILKNPGRGIFHEKKKNKKTVNPACMFNGSGTYAYIL